MWQASGQGLETHYLCALQEHGRLLDELHFADEEIKRLKYYLEEIFSNPISDHGFVSRIYEELLQLKKTVYPIPNRQKI